jgi:hypothetical protein
MKIRERIEKLRKETQNLHDEFSCAYDSQHTLIDMAVHCFDKILEDDMYGKSIRDAEESSKWVNPLELNKDKV